MKLEYMYMYYISITDSRTKVCDNKSSLSLFQRMALHVVRSLGQAFDICHKLNPKPAKKKEEGEGEKGKAGDAAEGEEGEETTKSPTGIPSHWKTFNTDIDSAMEKLSLEGGGGEGGGDAGKEKPSGSDDLLGLNFDPFITPAAPADAFAPNGSLVDPFQSSFTSGGDSSAVAYPPLTVSNLSTNLPDFPDGVDPASITVPPPHMAYFAIGGQRPPGFAAGGQQVGGKGSVLRGGDIHYNVNYRLFALGKCCLRVTIVCRHIFLLQFWL